MMIDIHCHILPGVDDGAKTMHDSLEMARKAVEEGISTIIATPHHKNSQFTNNRELIIPKVNKLNAALKDNGIPLEILPGQETRIHGEVIDGLDKGEILPLAETQYVFVELPSGTVPAYTKTLLFDIQMKGLIPIIVHPERNQEIIEHPDRLYEMVKDGALTQVTAASVCGYFGKKIKNFSHQLIESNLTHFIASDAHNTTTRAFKLAEGYEEVEKKFGMDLVYLFQENAELLIEDKNIYREVPEAVRRKKLLGIF